MCCVCIFVYLFVSASLKKVDLRSLRQYASLTRAATKANTDMSLDFEGNVVPLNCGLPWSVVFRSSAFRMARTAPGQGQKHPVRSSCRKVISSTRRLFSSPSSSSSLHASWNAPPSSFGCSLPPHASKPSPCISYLTALVLACMPAHPPVYTSCLFDTRCLFLFCARQVQRGAAATATTTAVGSSSAPSPSATAAPYSGMLDALQRGYRAGGVAGLFKGSGARMAFQAPSIAITMAAFEKSKEVWGSLLS